MDKDTLHHFEDKNGERKKAVECSVNLKTKDKDTSTQEHLTIVEDMNRNRESWARQVYTFLSI